MVVKVQRPGVQAAISVDILVLRYLAGLIRRIGNFNSDLQVMLRCLLEEAKTEYNA